MLCIEIADTRRAGGIFVSYTLRAQSLKIIIKRKRTVFRQSSKFGGAEEN